MELQLQQLDPSAKAPEYVHPADAGMNLYTVESKSLQPGERYAFATGWAMAFPPNYVARILDRSGLAVHAGIHCLAGVIDANYRGEWKIVLINHGAQPYDIQKGDKIAQVVFMPIERAMPRVVPQLNDSERGSGGFGSTGR